MQSFWPEDVTVLAARLPGVRRAGRERGLYVMAYTINDAHDIRAAARAGADADAIITDHPATARMALTSCSGVVKVSGRSQAAPVR